MGWLFARMNAEPVENTDEIFDDMEIAAYFADGEYVKTTDFEREPLSLAVKTGNRMIHFWATDRRLQRSDQNQSPCPSLFF